MTYPLVLVPTFNERGNLEPFVSAVRSALPSADILVIDDNSPDGTGDLADHLAAVDPQIKVMHRKSKAGLGRAYLAGFAWALERDYSHVFEIDADFSHNPVDLPRLLAATQTADIALGCRWTKGGGVTGWPLSRLLISRVGNLYAKTILGVSLNDLTGGFMCVIWIAADACDPNSRGLGIRARRTFLYRVCVDWPPVVKSPLYRIFRTVTLFVA